MEVEVEGKARKRKERSDVSTSLFGCSIVGVHSTYGETALVKHNHVGGRGVLYS